MELSFIIPIYNTPIDVLKRCIDSICELNNVNYEIILVDDGSNEINSKEYKRINKQGIKISYYKRKNSGVSATRNYGLHKSVGEYVMFVDSDDVLYLNNLDYKLLDNNYDAIYFNYKDIYLSGAIIEKKEINSNDSCVITPIDIIREFIEFDKFYAPWNKIFRREFLISNNVEFDTTMINGEDAVFNLNVLLADPKMYYCNQSIYGYYNSISNYENRVKNKFDSILHDYLYKYNIKIETIKKYNLEYRILKKIQNDAVNQCFRISMICSKYKMNKAKEISSYIIKFNINKKDLSIVNKIKYNILNKKRWTSVHFLSKLRNIYLRIKRR